MDSIIPTAIVTTVSAVNAAIASVKNAREMAKQSQDTDLKNLISDAYDAVLDLKDKVLELGEENRSLKERLEQRETVKRDPTFGYYFKEGNDPDPLCPKCYEADGKMMHLDAVTNRAYSEGRLCRTCGQFYTERPTSNTARYSVSKPGWMES